MVTATGSYKIKQKLALVDMRVLSDILIHALQLFVTQVTKLESTVCENGFVIAVPNLNKAFRFQAQ